MAFFFHEPNFQAAIDKEYEDLRITNCYQELSQMFISYSTQQQEIATNLEKKVLESLESYEKIFCEADTYIQNQSQMVKIFFIQELGSNILRSIDFENTWRCFIWTVKTLFQFSTFADDLIIDYNLPRIINPFSLNALNVPFLLTLSSFFLFISR